ncbi:hypothetical protein EVG20_g6035 [Dentipellis fragilis]|uniref:SET domain-containing protein n=1 Tax=Dentipellis fragilis TaxID=205917 RepID=A0A4Y9YP03_9AGAM|nr:hypothetical protein EVG20_g6035 [Dentipellis fragilis]
MMDPNLAPGFATLDCLPRRARLVTQHCTRVVESDKKRVAIFVTPLILAALTSTFHDGQWNGLNFGHINYGDDAVHADIRSPPFAVQSLPGRGKGLIAIRNIKRGELLIREAPLFIVPHTVTGSPVELILNMVRGLSPEQSEAFYNLSYVHLPPGLRPEAHAANVPLAIFQTNAVAAGAGVGLFPNMARLNHGYTKRPRDERRDFLKQTYDFECTCACCALGPEESRASDGRLSRMRELYGRLASWSHGGINGREAIRIVREIWAVGTAEGYTSERGQLAADAATVACAHSEYVGLPYVRRRSPLTSGLAVRRRGGSGRGWQREWGRIELGAESFLVSSASRTAASPWEHRMWGTREEMTVGGPIEP